MKWTIENVEPLNIVIIKAEGELIVGGHLEMFKDIISQDFWKPGKNILFDYRKFEFDGTDIPLIKRLSNHRRKYDAEIGDGKSALLMKSLADYARGRQIELMTTYEIQGDLRIFMEEDKAIEWLNS